MKNLTISLLAAWGASIRSFVDGDLFRESTLDLLWGDLADRLGYLKTAVDGKPSLASNNTWTGDNTFDTGTGPYSNFIVTGDNGATFNTPLVCNSSFNSANNASMQGETGFSGYTHIDGTLALSSENLGDANANVGQVVIHRVPQLTANRAYTLPALGAGYHDKDIHVIVRMRTADAFTVTVQDATPTTLGVISASAAGWIAVQYNSGWKVIAWGGTVTGLSTTA